MKCKHCGLEITKNGMWDNGYRHLLDGHNHYIFCYRFHGDPARATPLLDSEIIDRLLDKYGQKS